jgi:hypothetical protein
LQHVGDHFPIKRPSQNHIGKSLLLAMFIESRGTFAFMRILVVAANNLAWYQVVQQLVDT